MIYFQQIDLSYFFPGVCLSHAQLVMKKFNIDTKNFQDNRYSSTSGTRLKVRDLLPVCYVVLSCCLCRQLVVNVIVEKRYELGCLLIGSQVI